MPEQYVRTFTQLQDNIPPWETAVVQAIATESLQKDCPAFADYDSLVLDHEPLGSASIGQVHRAVLTRNGKAKEVAVKVMHAGAQVCFQHDFQVFRWLCGAVLPGWSGLLDALERQVLTEFDYRQEAESLREVRDILSRSPYRRRVCVPELMKELCSKNDDDVVCLCSSTVIRGCIFSIVANATIDDATSRGLWFRFCQKFLRQPAGLVAW
mgnify:FL=1